MATFHGVNISWGIDSTIYGVNGLFQTREHNYKVESELIKDTDEFSVSKAYWDPSEEASFSYIAFQNINTTLGDAIVNIPKIGQTIFITDGKYAYIIGYWMVDDIAVSNSNTSAVKVSLKLSRYPFVNPLIFNNVSWTSS